MITRQMEVQVRSGLALFPAVNLIGARQVGKTTLAHQLATEQNGVFFDLENPRHRLALEDPLGVLSPLADRLVVIDEAQRMGELFPVLRTLIDEKRSPGRFLLLGSAAPDLRRQAAESLAGRVLTLTLQPLALGEVGIDAWEPLWLRGGFPVAFQAAKEADSMTWRRAYLRDLVDRDLRLLGFDLAPERMRQFTQMLAHLHGQLWNASAVARNLGFGVTQTARYLEIMQQTLLVHRLSPYYTNLGKRLVKAPKVYWTDSGLVHALLDIPDSLTLRTHPVADASWEGFVLQQVVAVLPENWEVSFWRTAVGAEIDLLLLKNGHPEIAIECKLNASHPKLSRGFHQACDDLKLQHRWLVYPGNEVFPLGNYAEAISLEQMLVRLAKQRGV